MDLTRIININKPTTRVQYELHEVTEPNLEDILGQFIKDHNLTKE